MTEGTIVIQDRTTLIRRRIRGEHGIFADFLRTAGDKHGFHLSNMNNHHPNIMNSIRKRRY